MNLLDLFKRPNPGRELALIGQRQQRERVRARVDELREQMGLPAVKWPK